MTELFNDDTNKNPENNQNLGNKENANPTPDYLDQLAGIKNERGEQKFNSVEDLIKGYNASQDFIGTLKDEKTSIESQAADLASKVKSQEELEDLLNKKQEPEVVTKEVHSGLTQEDVLAVLQQREVETVEKANRTVVKEAAKAAKVDLKEACEKAGIAPEFADNMAKSYPEQFLKLVGIEAPKAPAAPLNGSVNTSTFNMETPQTPKTVMRSSKASDLESAWKAAGQRSEARLKEQGLL